MPSIVLATLNAKYPHCAFGLRYLLANMGELRDETALLEFTINQQTLEILDAILAQRPRIVGLGVYIWNVAETTRLVADLKRVAPDVIVVLGGPEISYENDQQEIARLADYVITGEGDLAFASLCRELMSGGQGDKGTGGLKKDTDLTSDSFPHSPCPLVPRSLIHAPVPTLTDLALPYDLYSDEDIAQRVLYVEASRGCPFTCEFCLSALDIPVRQFSLEQFLAAMERLLERGARQFKFVDRTFNLNLRVSRAILDFFLQRYQPGMFLHFELIPDRLPDSLKELIVQFPPGALQFEVGIQTFNDDVSNLISRHQDNSLVEQNLSWLRDHTSVHVHADLIVGLPGESLDSFAAGFDRLVRLAPHEIQVGILKRLRGTPIVRHDAEWQMVYSPHPPYEVLQTKLMDFATIQELRRFAKHWDAVANSGNFVETVPQIWSEVRGQKSEVRREQVLGVSPLHSFGAGRRESPGFLTNCAPSPFAEFRRLSSWLFAREGHSHGISLSRLVELLFEYLTAARGFTPHDVAAAMWRDYQRGGRSDKPACLKPFIDEAALVEKSRPVAAGRSPKRQARHVAATVLGDPTTQ